ncbi:MAG: 50S ribosomal protein L23 [Candidatus Omnitrophica bacterium]|nr:50S ribosomal protein L23 [Candidatus Omnitrophota bacterium]
MSINKSIYSIIKAPLVTEKASVGLTQRKYVFLVDKTANKLEIKNAITKLYKVKVENVTSMVVKGKMKRLRGNQQGKTAAWKKAVVTLKPGSEIKFT